jgi:hypothetical protein
MNGVRLILTWVSVLPVSLTIGCGAGVATTLDGESGGTTAGGTDIVTPGRPNPTGRATSKLQVSERDVLVVGRRILGALPACNEPFEGDTFRIELAAKRVTRTVRIRQCGDGDGGVRPMDDRKVAGEVTVSDADRDALLATARAIELEKIEKCLGFDGESFLLDVEREGGAEESYTDGISFGCDLVAHGHEKLHAKARALVP